MVKYKLQLTLIFLSNFASQLITIYQKLNTIQYINFSNNLTSIVNQSKQLLPPTQLLFLNGIIATLNMNNFYILIQQIFADFNGCIFKWQHSYQAQGISNLDLFGQQIYMNINKEPFYKSKLGGITSLLMIGILILFFYSNLISFFNRTNLTYEEQTNFETNPSRMILTAETYMGALEILQSNFSTNPFFNISVIQMVYYRFPNGTSTTSSQHLTLEQCTLDHFQPIFSKQGIDFSYQFNLLGLQNWLCFSKNYSIYLNGTYSSQIFEFLEIVVSDCVNGSTNKWKPVCASQEQRDQYLQTYGDFKLQYFTTNQIVNPSKPHNYLETYLDDTMYFPFIPKQLKRNADIFYRKHHIRNDNSLIPISIWENIDLNIKSDSEFRDIAEVGRQSDSQYVVLYIRSSSFSQLIIRKFQKIGDLLSNLGGFLQIMIMVCGIIISFYNRIIMMVKISNNIFDYKQNDQEINITSINDSIENDIKLDNNIPLKYNQKGQTELKGNIYKHDIIAQSIIDFKNKYNYINMNIRLFINQLTGNKLFISKNTEKFNKAINRIYNELEVTNVIRKLTDVENLKYLILNNNQQILMSILPKIQLYNEHTIKSKYLNLNDFIQSKKKVKESSHQINQINQVNIMKYCRHMKQYQQNQMILIYPNCKQK
ncbi:hypothetical protein pb186bvf_011896 [Paramecium bursaria]